jgi:hypothetical protein
MKRPAGITVSGVIALIGSLLLVLLSIFIIASLRSLPSTPSLPEGTPAVPVNVAGILVVESVVLLGFAVAGIVSAIALLRRRNWGRISFLVFAGLLGGLSLAAMIGELVAMFVAPMMLPPQQNVPRGFLTVVFGIAAIFFLALVGLSVWWLIYFTRRSVKAHFLSEAEIATPRRGPLSVTIIAWLLVVSGVLVSLNLFISYPVVMFGFVFRGWSAHLLLLLFGAISFVAGLGMLRWRPAAHSLALAFYGLSLLSIGSSLILPSSFAQMLSVMRETVAQSTIPGTPFPGDRFLWFSLLLGLAGVCVPLWFLITRRKAFLDACREPSLESGSQAGHQS